MTLSSVENSRSSGPTVDPLDMLVQDEFHRTLAAVQRLPETDRTLLLMRAAEELSYKDIAAAAGLSVAAAKVRVFRARARLAALLHTDDGGKP